MGLKVLKLSFMSCFVLLHFVGDINLSFYRDDTAPYSGQC